MDFSEEYTAVFCKFCHQAVFSHQKVLRVLLVSRGVFLTGLDAFAVMDKEAQRFEANFAMEFVGGVSFSNLFAHFHLWVIEFDGTHWLSIRCRFVLSWCRSTNSRGKAFSVWSAGIFSRSVDRCVIRPRETSLRWHWKGYKRKFRTWIRTCQPRALLARRRYVMFQWQALVGFVKLALRCLCFGHSLNNWSPLIHAIITFSRLHSSAIGKQIWAKRTLADSRASVHMLRNSFSSCCNEIQTAHAIAFLGAVEFTVVHKYTVLHLICFVLSRDDRNFQFDLTPLQRTALWQATDSHSGNSVCRHSPCVMSKRPGNLSPFQLRALSMCNLVAERLSCRYESFTEDLTAPKCVHPKEGCTENTGIEFMVMELGHRSLSCSESRVPRRNSRTKRSRITRQKSCARILWKIVSCYGWSCTGIVPCAVSGVGTKRMHQDVSCAFALGPFGSSAFFFCSLCTLSGALWIALWWGPRQQFLTAWRCSQQRAQQRDDGGNIDDENVLQSLNLEDRVTRSTQTRDPGGPPPISRATAASDWSRSLCQIQTIRLRLLSWPKGGDSARFEMPKTTRPHSALPFQRPDEGNQDVPRLTATYVALADSRQYRFHSQISTWTIWTCRNSLCPRHARSNPLSSTRPLVSRRTPFKYPVGKTWKLKSTWEHSRNKAQDHWQRHRFDSELALELPHSPERPRARSQNTSQKAPTLNLLV